MPLGQYLLGAVFFALTVGAVGAAAAVITVRRLAHLPSAARGLALALLWLAGLVLAALLPAAATVLSRGTVLVTAMLVLLVTWALCRRGPDLQADISPDQHEFGITRVLAGLALAALLVVVLAYL